ncbi:hypothetical protein FJY68_01230 [candidate division WOR-3 bacterium]|uniref:Uncharacterized protein n=1 Tax=candidate division WOR-3 bacterium TaxID=2052148 RepID=A0A937XB77_UNCW3|nr:hypothetical protein [candidate division WOR-3 bacterium]
MRRCVRGRGWLSGRLDSLQNLAGKPLLACVVLLGFSLCFGWTPSVPDTILLPDSLGPLRPGYHLAFGSSTDNIYVASESSDVMVVDGNQWGTFQRIKRIYTNAGVGGALLVSKHNRLYVSHPSQGRIGVIDCSTNEIVGSILVGTRPKLLCYSSGSDKLYCGDTIDKTVSVIDCATNGLLKVIPVGRGLTAMAYDPTTAKMYAATREAVLAISCSADSIVSAISAVKAASALCVNKRRQKLYVVPPHADGALYAISTPTDSVAARMSGDGYLMPVLACNEVTDRLYNVNDAGGMLEFDCVGDALIRYVPVSPLADPAGLFCDSVRNRLYYLWERDDRGYLYELDCVTLDLMSWTYVGLYPAILQADPARYRLMCAGGRGYYAYDRALTVFDYKSDSFYARGGVPLSGWTQVMCHNSAAGKLYYWWGLGVGGVGVIDEQTNRLVAQVFLSRASLSEHAYSRTSNKLYLQVPQGGLGVMDVARDSIIRVIGMVWGRSPTWCVDEDKVYCYAGGTRWYVTAVDCSTDSVVREIDIYDRFESFEYLGDGRILCRQWKHLTLIDSRADTVLVDSAVEPSEYRAIAHTGKGNKVYIALNGRLEVRSSSTLSLLTTLHWPYAGHIGGGGFLVCSDTTRKLYWFSDFGDSVLAVDTRGDTVTARMATSVSYKTACLDHTGRYMFCAGFYSSLLRVYDTQSDSLIGTYPHPQYPRSITPAPEQHCIYVGFDDFILAYPDIPPGVEEATNDELEPMNAGASVVLDVLLFGPPSGCPQRATGELMDVSGRRVKELRAGANDVRALPPGIYFMHAGERGLTRKIIIAR